MGLRGPRGLGHVFGKRFVGQRYGWYRMHAARLVARWDDTIALLQSIIFLSRTCV